VETDSGTQSTLMIDSKVPKDMKPENLDIKQLTGGSENVRMDVEKQEMDLQSPIIIAQLYSRGEQD
jgi:hypothetical protein